MRSARDLHQHGVALLGAGRVRAARRPLELALARCEDGALTGAIEASLAYVEAETGDRAAALELCDRAAERPDVDRETLGVIHSQRALLLMLAGDTAAAIHDYGRAIALLHDPVHLGRAYGNRGNLYLQQGDTGRAAADFDRALAQFRLTDLVVDQAMNEHNLGYTCFLLGDLPGALRHMDAARPVLAPLSAVAAATCDQDRAEVLMAAGLAAEGRRALAAAATAYGAARLPRRRAEAELALARHLLTESPAEAARAARGAARRFRADGAEPWAVRAEAVALAGLLAGAGPGAGPGARARRVTDAQVARCREVVAALEEQGLSAEARRLSLSLLRARPGSLDVPRVTRRDPLAVRLLAADVAADLQAARGQRSAALRSVRRGLADLHEWQSSFGSLDLQTNVVGQGVRLAARALELAVESRSTRVLLEWSERARMLASRVQPVQAPSDPCLAADLAELRSGVSPAREADLRRRIREQAWQRAGSGEVAEPVSLAELQGRLTEGTWSGAALVAYVVAAGRVVALVVTADRVTRVELGDRTALDAVLGGLLPDLDMAAGDLPGAIGRAVRGELATRLDRLAALLVQPLLPLLGERAVVLTPSGVLAGVPWSLLPGLAGRPVTVAQSATSWLARRETPLRTSSAGLVAGPRVVRAEDEVLAAAKEWASARVLLGGEATAGAVSGLAAEVDVLHVAAHGRHSADSPLFSGLQLVDGAWFGYDIDQLDHVPDVVLLSACEVGRSTVRWGEELIGMTAAWLHAGARCVIASPAAVADQAAYDAVVGVHQRLAAGADPAEALAAVIPAPTADRAPAPFLVFS